MSMPCVSSISRILFFQLVARFAELRLGKQALLLTEHSQINWEMILHWRMANRVTLVFTPPLCNTSCFQADSPERWTHLPYLQAKARKKWRSTERPALFHRADDWLLKISGTFKRICPLIDCIAFPFLFTLCDFSDFLLAKNIFYFMVGFLPLSTKNWKITVMGWKTLPFWYHGLRQSLCM